MGKEGLSLGKRKEADEIARLDEAMKQVIAKTDEYKKELLAKKKQLEELNVGLGSGGEWSYETKEDGMKRYPWSHKVSVQYISTLQISMTSLLWNA